MSLMGVVLARAGLLRKPTLLQGKEYHASIYASLVIPRTLKLYNMTCYIVVLEGSDGALRYGNRNKLMKYRDNAVLHSSPSSAKAAAKRLLCMHPDISRAVVCVYNVERHPEIRPVQLVREGSGVACRPL